MTNRPTMRTTLLAMVGVVLLAGAGCGAKGHSSSVSNPPPADALTPLLGSVPFAPVPFAGSDGKTHMVYELAVTNFTGATLTVDDVKIEDSQSGRVLGDLDATR